MFSNFFQKKFKKLNKNKIETVKQTEGSFQKWLNIKAINENKIILNSGETIAILKVLPINFKLKSQLEQNAILNSYKLFLKNLNSEIQILVSSRKTDVSMHLDEILKNTNENSPIYEMSKDYIDLINNIIEQKGTISKEFYIIIRCSNNIQNDVLKITEYLITCGNEVQECSNKQIISVLSNFLNKRLMNITNYC